MNQILVRDGKGKKDRITVLPDGAKPALNEHLVYVKRLHKNDLDAGYGRVYLPNALARKYPNADKTKGVAVCVPCQNAIRRPKIGNEKKTPSACQQYSEGNSKIRKIVRNCQARWLSYAEAQLCHAPAGGWL